MKKMLLLLISTLLLACTCAVPVELSRGIRNPFQPTSTPFGLGVTVVRLHKSDGDLLTQLQAHAPKAAALRQRMFVEFDTSW